MSDRYWLSAPGSKEPPKGPLSLVELTEAWQAGTIEPTATICKVGESNWVKPETVLGPRTPKARTGELPKCFRYQTADQIEGKYSDLARVASSLELLRHCIEGSCSDYWNRLACGCYLSYSVFTVSSNRTVRGGSIGGLVLCNGNSYRWCG